MDFLLHVSKYVISGFLAIEIAYGEFFQCALSVGCGPVSFLREINLHSFFPCNFDVSTENLIKAVEGFGPGSILFLAGSIELCESVGEEELDAIASRVRYDFEVTLLAVCLVFSKRTLPRCSFLSSHPFFIVKKGSASR